MKKSRRGSRKMTILKVAVCVLLLFSAGYIAKVLLTKHDMTKPVTNVSGQGAKVEAVQVPTATPVKEEHPTLNKESANIYVTNTFDLKVKDTTETVTYSSSDEKVATVSSDGVVTGIGKGKAVITATAGTATLSCDVTVKKSKLIALTFDDGPGAFEPTILDVLEKYDARATFFVVGQNINDRTANYLKREIELGCEIGNHSYTHPNFKKISVDKIKKEVSKTNDAIWKAAHIKPSICRAPYGGYLERVKEAIDMPQVVWNVDTLDWKYRDTKRLIKYVLANAKDGDVVLMHSIHKTTVDGIEDIVKGLKKKGFELVTVSELAAAKNTTMENHKLYGSF